MKRYSVAAVTFAALFFAGAAHAVTCNPITVAPAVFPEATINQAYSQLLGATGGTFPYQFTVTLGTLPPGLKISVDRVVGTPSQAGTFSFSLTATDSVGCTGSNNYSLLVKDPNTPTCPTILISPSAMPSGAVGALYSTRISATGGTPPYTYSIFRGSLPPGLGLASGTLTGYPTTAGTFSFDLLITDAKQCSAAQHYEVDITGANCPQDVAAIIAPSNGSTFDSTRPVTFGWTAVAGASSYDVLVSGDGGATFRTAASTDAGTTSASMSLGEGSYIALIRTIFSSSCSTRSALTRFTVTGPTQCGGGTINLLSPANNATVSSPVTFSWSAVPGATAYRVWGALDNAAPALFARVTGTSITSAVPNGAAEWYVEALFDSCPSVVSSHGKFTVARASNCGTNAAPSLVSPLAGDVTSPVTFAWGAVPGASAYRLWIAPADQSFSDAGATVNTQLNRELAAGTYSWYVEAIFGGCPTASAAKATFRVPETTIACPRNPATPLAPANGAVVPSPVTFSWTAVANAKEYRVLAAVNGGDAQNVGTTTETTLTKSMPPGAIVWSVETTFRGCAATHSAPARFTVPRATSCPTDKPQLLSPANNATNVTSPATFSWSTVIGAARYIVVVKGQNGAATAIGETALTQLQRDVPAGTIEWFVVAIGAGCDPVLSDHNTFSVAAPASCDSRRPHPLAPADDSVNVASPVHFSWTRVLGATSYRLFAAVNGEDPALITTSTTNEVTAPMPAGRIHWFVEAILNGCPALFSALSDVTVAGRPAACSAPDRPTANVVAQVLSGTEYNVRWTGVRNASVFELQESASADFSGATTTTITGVAAPFTHSATAAPVQFFYRVRAVSACSDDRSAYSRVVSTRVIPPNTAASRTRGSAEIGVQNPVVQTLTLAGSTSPVAFIATADKPWLTVSPSSGTIPTTGLTLTVTADPRALHTGANHGTVRITYPGSSGRIVTNANTPPKNVPVSISLVTPVAPDTAGSPSQDSLIIPAVAHGPGANSSLFQSDIRLANVSSQAVKYLINFTPTSTDGTQTGTTTTIQVEPGVTTALDDILSSFFGTAAGGSSTGMLEIRPLTSNNSSSSLFSSVPSSALASVASSRTYNVTSQGTFGQFIPALPLSQFVGKGTILSLQQIAQSAAYRTNFGLVEASGEPATVILHVFDKSGNLLADIPESLLPSEHLALNGLLAANNITLDDGRVEVEVTSSTGKVSAYASVLDNKSNDPLLVSAVQKSSVKSNRYVIPGVAYSNGLADWRTDVRLYNAASSSVNATLTYYPQGAPSSPLARTASIAAGETLGIDNILNSMFGITDPNAGGSVVVTTTATSNIIASARTYAATDNGTIGQFIPAVTPAQSVGAADRSLQILQLEQSDAFRTNIGLAETTGNAVTVEASLILPDSKVTPVVTFSLAANEFVQFPLSYFSLTDSIYNARVSVKAVSGSGKVTAYGSLVDNTSKDPTYVPAQ